MNLKTFSKTMHSYANTLNKSKFFAALVMLMMNFGSRYIDVKFSKSQETYLKNTLGKPILIFAISWMGTRDIYISLIIMLGFTFLVDFLFNEDSNMCLMPETLKHIEEHYDLNGDGVVTEDEIKAAQDILKKAQKHNATQKHKATMMNAQSQYLTNM